MRDLFAALLVVLAAAPVWADPPAELPGDPPLFTGPPQVGVWVLGEGWSPAGPEDDPADAAVREKLETLVTFNDEAIGFGRFLESLREQTGVQFAVDWESCELSGIDADSLTHLQVEGVSARVALELAIANVSANAFDDEKAGYTIRDGLVRISTLAELKCLTELRLYDLRILVRERFRPVGLMFEEDAFLDTLAFHEWRRGQRKYPFSDATQIRQYRRQIEQMEDELADLIRREEIDPEAQRDARGQAGGGVGLFGDDEIDGLDFNPGYREWIEQLSQAIQENIGDPDEWLDEDSYMDEIGGLLIVSTTRENHAQVQALLDGMLEAEIEDQAAILRDAQVMRLLSRASVMQLEGNFEGALSLAERALLIDPDHGPARAMYRVLRDTMDRIEDRTGPPQG